MLMQDHRRPRAEAAVPERVTSALRAGRLVMLGSSRQRDGRGRTILCGVAGLMTEEKVTRMCVHGRGLVSITVDALTAFHLGLRRMSGTTRGTRGDAEFLVSIEASACEGTGISASDRAMTMRAAGSPHANQDDLTMPGHVMPLLVPETVSFDASLPEIAHAIIIRHTAYSVAAWCDVLDEAGDVASLNESIRLGESLDIPVFVPDYRAMLPVITDLISDPAQDRASSHRLPDSPTHKCPEASLSAGKALKPHAR